MLTNKTLKRRFAILLAIYSLLVIGLLFLYHIYAYNQLSRSARENIESAADSLLKSLDSEFSRMKIISSAIAGSTYVQDFLTEQDTSAYYEKAATVGEIIRKTTYPAASADNILTLNVSGTWYRFTGGLSDDACKTIRGAYERGELSSYTVVELDGAQYFCHIAPVYSPAGRSAKQIGLVVLLNNLEKTRRLVAGKVSGVCTAVILDGKILLSDNPELEGKSTGELTKLYEEVITAQVSGTKLYAAAALSDTALRAEGNMFLVVSLGMLILFITVIALFYRFLSSKMIVPMLTKTEKMQMGLLSTQIDAHFVVNTISTIQNLCRKGESEKAERISEGLNSLIRYQHEAGETINIFTELERLEQYIEIINARNENRFDVSFEMNDLLSEYLMPNQILQPFVENSIKHGFAGKKADCKIIIRGRLSNKAIILEITDNGAGMNSDELDALRKRLYTADRSDFPDQGLSGVALVNIQKRLWLRYGKKYGLTIESEPEAGTTVTICFPPEEDK